MSTTIGSREAQPLADADVPAALASIALPSAMSLKRQAAMPEQDRLVVALAARLVAGRDLAELGMKRRLAQPAALDMGAQRAELAGLALAPVVDDDLGP